MLKLHWETQPILKLLYYPCLMLKWCWYSVDCGGVERWPQGEDPCHSGAKAWWIMMICSSSSILSCMYIHFICQGMNAAVLCVFLGCIFLHKQVLVYICTMGLPAHHPFNFLIIKLNIICHVYFAPIQIHTRGYDHCATFFSFFLYIFWNCVFISFIFFNFRKRASEKVQLKIMMHIKIVR